MREPPELTLFLTFLRGPPASGIGDCSETHLYIDLKLADFSYISKTKILKKFFFCKQNFSPVYSKSSEL